MSIIQELKSKKQKFISKYGHLPKTLIICCVDFARYSSYLADNYTAKEIRERMDYFDNIPIHTNPFVFESEFI